MKKLLLIVAVLVVALIGAWYFGLFKGKNKPSGPKPEGLTVSKHSNSFNESMSNAMNSYYTLTESFVNWDTATINTSLAELKSSVDSIRIQEMEKDSAIYPTVQSQWESIKAMTRTITTRRSFFIRKKIYAKINIDNRKA